MWIFFFFQAEDGIRDYKVTGVQTCALPISRRFRFAGLRIRRRICMMGVYLLSKTRWNSSIWCWNFSWHNPRKGIWWLFCGCYSEGQAPLLKQGNRKTRTKAYELPGLALGDVLLIGSSRIVKR